MDPFLLGPAAGILGGLFGSHQNFGSGADMSAGRGYLGDLSGIASQWGGLSQQALGSYANDNGAYRGAVGNYANYLQQDPFTDQRDAASLANATRGTAGAYQQANANLTNSLAARGLDTGTNGGASSQLAGGLAGIASGQAASLAGAQNQLAYNQIGQRRANMEGLVGLLGGVAGQDYSRGVGALGAQQGLDQGLASDYLGLGQREQGLQLGYDQQVRQGIGAGVSGIGNVLGMDAYRNQYPGGAYGGMFGLLGGGGQGGYGGGMMNQVAGLNF